ASEAAMSATISPTTEIRRFIPAKLGAPTRPRLGCFGPVRAGRVLVVPGPQFEPLRVTELPAGMADLGELLEVLLARRPGREHDQHRRRFAADVVESVHAALGHIDEIAG